ncbi:MAG: hypothetical protein Q4B60_09410, partial [Erysipelotrichaceae bacterium]|nr:hypothetical protein [Erysipelotrichaceae bacterium]
MKNTPVKGRKLRNIFLIPLIGLVLVQGIALLTILYASGVKSTMEKNSVENSIQVLENKQLMLENAMLNEWGGLGSEADSISYYLE